MSKTFLLSFEFKEGGLTFHTNLTGNNNDAFSHIGEPLYTIQKCKFCSRLTSIMFVKNNVEKALEQVLQSIIM